MDRLETPNYRGFELEPIAVPCQLLPLLESPLLLDSARSDITFASKKAALLSIAKSLAEPAGDFPSFQPTLQPEYWTSQIPNPLEQ